VHDAAKGQVWTGADAKAKGLVDELGGFATALKLAREAAGLAPDAEVRLVEFPPPPTGIEALQNLFDASASGGEGAREAATLARLLQIVEPVARVLAPVMQGADARNVQLPAIQTGQ
jgi:protease IV